MIRSETDTAARGSFESWLRSVKSLNQLTFNLASIDLDFNLDMKLAIATVRYT